MIVSFHPAGARAERFELPGEKVAIWNLAGTVEIVRGSGPQVVVDVRRGGSDADRLDVQTGEIDGRRTLRVVYPTNRVKYGRGLFGWGSHTSLRVGRDGRFGDGSSRTGGRKVAIGSFGLDAHADLQVEIPRGRRVAVYLAVGELTALGIEGALLLDGVAASVRAADTRGSLTIDVGSGQVSVQGAEGDVSVDTGSGGIEITKVSGPSLVLDTGSGSVMGSDVRVERLRVDTGSGSVEFADLRAADILVDTGSGRVTLDLRADVRSLRVDTGSGGVTIGVPSDLGAEVWVDSGSGRVHSDVPMQLIHKRRDSMRALIGDGDGRIVIDTGSGSVRFLHGRSGVAADR